MFSRPIDAAGELQRSLDLLMKYWVLAIPSALASLGFAVFLTFVVLSALGGLGASALLSGGGDVSARHRRHAGALLVGDLPYRGARPRHLAGFGARHDDRGGSGRLGRPKPGFCPGVQRRLGSHPSDYRGRDPDRAPGDRPHHPGDRGGPWPAAHLGAELLHDVRDGVNHARGKSGSGAIGKYYRIVRANLGPSATAFFAFIVVGIVGSIATRWWRTCRWSTF